MTLEQAKAEYEAILAREPSPEEIEAGLRDLIRLTDKINVGYYPICDNDNEGEPYP